MPEIAHLEQHLIELRRQYYTQFNKRSDWEGITTKVDLSTLAVDLLIEFMRVNDHIYATVVGTSGQSSIHSLTANHTLLDWLDELTLTFQCFLTLPREHQSQHDLIVECQSLLAQGFDLLIRPLAIAPNVKRILIAPCTQLHTVPFAALWDGNAYLMEKYELEFTPTSALLFEAMPKAQLADPLIIASSAGGQLPANCEQAMAISQIYSQATCLIDEDSTLEQLTTLPVAPKFVHIAAHTIAQESNPLFTSLQLSHATLAVEACYELPIYGTELVTLCSCITNAGMESDGALLAFQSAFFAAGVQRVISTLWQIQGDVSSLWMQAFYTNLHQGLPPALALRQTQLTFIQNGSLSHPAYWAAFACSRR